MKAHELLADEKNWIKGVLSRDEDGIPCMPSHPTACCWCASGAIMKVYRDPKAQNNAYDTLEAHLLKEKHLEGIVNWNDAEERTHQEIISLLKELDI